MRILIIHTKYTLEGGEDVVVRNEANLLSEHQEVEVLYFQNKPGVKGLLQFLFSIYNLKAARTVRKKIDHFRPDIIHVHNWHFASGPIIFRTIRKKKIPFVHTMHNYRTVCPSSTLIFQGRLFTDSLRDKFPWSAVRKKVYRESWLLTFWLAFVTRVHRKAGTWQLPQRHIQLTNAAKDIFLQSGLLQEDNMVVKPNFIFPTQGQHANKDTHFIYIGRLSEEKGIRVLLAASDLCDHHFLIAGDGPLADEVKKKAATNKRITYLGKIDNATAKQKLTTSSALLFPSVCYETFGMTIVEAFSAGCAVIASNLGSPTELVQHGQTGFHFQYGDPAALVAAMDQWAALPAMEKERYYQQALATYQAYYSPQANYQQLLEIYKQVIDKEK